MTIQGAVGNTSINSFPLTLKLRTWKACITIRNEAGGCTGVGRSTLSLITQVSVAKEGGGRADGRGGCVSGCHGSGSGNGCGGCDYGDGKRRRR